MKIQHHQEGKTGGALVLAMVVMLAFSILAIGMFKLHNTDSLETVYVGKTHQAFWCAESGLQDIIQLIKRDQYSRNTSTVVTNELGRGSYEAEVVSMTSLEVAGSFEFTVESVGRVGEANRRLQQSIKIYPGIEAAIIGKAGSTYLKNNFTVDGPVIQYDGDIYTGNNQTAVIDGDIYVDNASQVTGQNQGMAIEGVPGLEPTMDSSAYVAEINSYATLSGSTGLYVTVISADTVFSNSVTFNKAVTINAGVKLVVLGHIDFKLTPTVQAGARIYAGGSIDIPCKSNHKDIGDGARIVANGTVDFGSQAELGRDVTILSGDDIIFSAQPSIGGGSVLFAVSDIQMGSGGTALLGDSSEGVSLMTEAGDIVIGSQTTFYGIMFSNHGIVDITADTEVFGTIIGGVGVNNEQANFTITYDPGIFKEGLPITIDFRGEVIAEKSLWKELPPL